MGKFYFIIDVDTFRDIMQFPEDTKITNMHFRNGTIHKDLIVWAEVDGIGAEDGGDMPRIMPKYSTVYHESVDFNGWREGG